MSPYATHDTALVALGTFEAGQHTHVLMPNMAWACGDNILTKPGHIAFPSDTRAVDCPDCLAFDPEELAAEARAMQGRQADVA